jgi:signal transduction histidine kinase
VTRLPSSPFARDLLLGAVLAVVAQVEITLTAERIEDPILWHRLVDLLILPAVGLRRVSPLASIAVAALGFAAEPLVGPAPVATPYLVLLFLLVSLGWHASTRVGVTGLGLVLAGGLTYDLTRDRLVVADLVVNVVIIVMAWAAGRLVRVTTDRRVSAELAADRAARDAVTRERERISRDLHDSMAHALTLITLQAGGARERTEQPLAEQALSAIERTGREALADMHRFLDLLGAGTDDAPGVGHLPELVEGVRRNGLAVDLEVEPVDLPGSLSTAVYRVVQEALTNVVRHSDAAAVRVEVLRDDHALVARVTDDGQGVATRVDGSGRGLTGLRERLALYDGTLESGATGTGWRVEARIPLGATG